MTLIFAPVGVYEASVLLTEGKWVRGDGAKLAAPSFHNTKGKVIVMVLTAMQKSEVQSKCKAAGCSDDECAKVEALLEGMNLPAIDWAALLQFVLQLIAIFHPPQPAPTP